MKGEDGHTPAEDSTVGTSHLTESGGWVGRWEKLCRSVEQHGAWRAASPQESLQVR